MFSWMCTRAERKTKNKRNQKIISKKEDSIGMEMCRRGQLYEEAALHVSGACGGGRSQEDIGQSGEG